MCRQPLPDEEKNRLTSYYQTISEQLNARLSESPRFFGVVVIASTAYGYVIWNWKTIQNVDLGQLLLALASFVFYITLLWAIWYLLALGYAFRYLQFSQHRIEDALGWDKYRSKDTGKPPKKIKSLKDLFWMLPGIYHAHLGGLIAIAVVLCGVFWNQWPDRCVGREVFFGFLMIAFLFTWWAGFHYIDKIRKVHDSQKQDECENVCDSSVKEKPAQAP
jgi:hypothetical protein